MFYGEIIMCQFNTFKAEHKKNSFIRFVKNSSIYLTSPM